jgi:hypothetical protein
MFWDSVLVSFSRIDAPAKIHSLGPFDPWGWKPNTQRRCVICLKNSYLIHTTAGSYKLASCKKIKNEDRYWEIFGTFWNVKERVKFWSCIVWVHTYISSVKYVFLQKCYLSLYLSCSFWNCPPSGIRFCIYFPGIKRPGRGVDYPPLSRNEIEYGTAVRVGQPFVTSVSLIAMQRRFFFPDLFLGAFAKCRKLLVASSCLSACLPVCPSTLNSWAATE